MARFIINDPEIRKVADGKQNAGKRYLVGKLENLNDPFADAQSFVCFSENIVNKYKDLRPTDKGGKAEAEQEIPEKYRTIYGVWCDFTPAQKFYKKHLSAHPELNIKVGDYVKDKDGNPIIYTTLRVFCRQFVDEDGVKQFAVGESPIEQGQRAFGAYCVAIKEDPTPQKADDEVIKVNEKEGATFTAPKEQQQGDNW